MSFLNFVSIFLEMQKNGSFIIWNLQYYAVYLFIIIRRILSSLDTCGIWTLQIYVILMIHVERHHLYHIQTTYMSLQTTIV